MAHHEADPIPPQDAAGIVVQSIQYGWGKLCENATRIFSDKKDLILQTEKPHELPPDIQKTIYDESRIGVRHALQYLSQFTGVFSGMLALEIHDVRKASISDLKSEYYALLQTHRGEYFAGNPGDVDSFDPTIKAPKPLVAYSLPGILSRIHNRTGGLLPSERKIREVLNNFGGLPKLVNTPGSNYAVLTSVRVVNFGGRHTDQHDTFDLFPIGNPQLSQRT